MKKKKHNIKKGDILYYECIDGNIYSTVACEIDGSDILTDDGEWMNKRDFLNPDDPKIQKCIGEQPIEFPDNINCKN